jgi:hypothetical protein
VVRWNGGPNVGRHMPHGEKHGVSCSSFSSSVLSTLQWENVIKNWVRESGKDSPLVREIITSYLRLR